MSNLIEPCPTPVSFQMNSCQDAAVIDLGKVSLPSLGRIVRLDAVIQNVCPGRRVAVAVLLTETSAAGEEETRGLKVFTIPAQTGTACTDVQLKCIRFVLPEEEMPGEEGTSLCNTRSLKASVIANYLDSDYICCDTAATV